MGEVKGGGISLYSREIFRKYKVKDSFGTRSRAEKDIPLAAKLERRTLEVCFFENPVSFLLRPRVLQINDNLCPKSASNCKCQSGFKRHWVYKVTNHGLNFEAITDHDSRMLSPIKDHEETL